MDNDLIFGTEASDSMMAEDMEGTQIAAATSGGAPYQDALTRPFDAAQVVIPEGENVVREPVTPGEIVELPFPADSQFLARIDNGNLAIKVGDVTVILQGYVEAAGQTAPVIEASNGQPLDIATILASTDPNIDIQTAAGPAAGPQGQGADNSGGILQQFGETAGLGGFEGAGALDGTDGLTGGTVDQTGTLFRQFGLLELNLAPIAQDETETTDEDTPFTKGQVTATDPEGDPLTYSLVNGPANGKLVFNPDGSWSFDPDGKFESLNNGETQPVTFQYKASDGTNESNVATVTINVTGVNDNPKAEGGFESTRIAENDLKSSTALGWTLTDVDDKTADLKIEYVGNNAPAGEITYNKNTQTLNFNTAGKYDLKDDEHIDYTVTFLVKDAHGGQTQRDVTVTITSQRPVEGDDVVLTNVGTNAAVVIPEWALVANDTDPDSTKLDVATTLIGPIGGSELTHDNGVGSNGTVTFKDDGALGGSFNYHATDGAAVSMGLGGNVTVTNQAGGNLTGTAAHEIIVAGDNATAIDGKGGNDFIFGGKADDTVVFHDGDVVQGGKDSINPSNELATSLASGDTLSIDHNVKLPTADLTHFSGIETIALKDDGFAQSLTIGASDVNKLSDHTITPGGIFTDEERAIKIDGDAVDQLYLSISKDGGNWVATGDTTANGYVVYAHATGGGDVDAYVMVHQNLVPNVHVNQDAP